MSRSLHTQKLEMRAARRLSRPYARRRDDGDWLKGRADVGPQQTAVAIRTVIKTQKPLPGYVHPLKPRDIHELAACIGHSAFYGVKCVRMRPECAISIDRIVFAEYLITGEIHLYAVPQPPWTLPFTASPNTLAAFDRHGARWEIDSLQGHTRVEWTASGLRDFYLAEVLSHELGHHLLQYHKGKRTAIVCRRKDHERRAGMQARRVEERLLRSRNKE